MDCDSRKNISEKTDVSIIIATYNSDFSKLRQTIESIQMQKDIKLEIIIADDGSNEDFSESIHKLYSNVKCHMNNINRGTVSNVYSILDKVSGEWIKLISPGDLLYEKSTLHDWVENARATNCVCSFSDVVFYNYKTPNEITTIRRLTQPQRPDLFSDKGTRFKNYLFNCDLCIGASFLLKREIFVDYMNLIHGKIKYAEDNIVRIMIYDGLKVSYFGFTAVVYEWGTGISTNKNNKWAILLDADWEAADQLMINRSCYDLSLKKKLILLSNLKRQNTKVARLKKYWVYKGRILFELKRIIAPRYSNIELSDDIKGLFEKFKINVTIDKQ